MLLVVNHLSGMMRSPPVEFMVLLYHTSNS